MFQDAVPTAFLVTSRAINIGQEIMRAAGDEDSDGSGETDECEESDDEKSEQYSDSATPQKRGTPASIGSNDEGSSESTTTARDDADKADGSPPAKKRGRP